MQVRALAFATDQMAVLQRDRWNVDTTIGLVIECGFSYRQVDRVRAALSLDYDAEVDRYYHPVWINIRGESTRLPEPIPSRKVWTAALREMKGDLKISLNEDGTVAALRLSAVVEDMVLTQRQLKMLRPGAGDSPENPVEIVFMFDGFPVERISVEHFCVGTASLRDDFSSQSEQLLRVINCSKIKENNPSLRRVAEYNSMGRDFNELVRVRGFKPTAPVEENDYPPFVHVEMLVAADKKGVEVHRGCSPCCAWCTCSDVQRLKLPWDPSTPPLTWASAEILLNQVCKRPFPSIPLIFEAAHVALPGEELPRHCRWCKKLPFASVAEYSAAMQRWSTMRADVSREGKKKFLKERSAHASTHISQYPFEFPAFLVGMDKVIPETLHIYDLNIDKQIYKQGIRRHLDEYTAGRVTDFFQAWVHLSISNVRTVPRTKNGGRRHSVLA